MLSWSRDLWFGLRALARSPLFTLVAAISLALGIGANTAIFTLIDQVLLRALPVHDPERLVLISTAGTHIGSTSGINVLSYPMYKDFRDQNEVFSGVLCSRPNSVAASTGGAAEITEGELVSGNYFQVLGIRAAAGRLFSPADETSPGANPVLVLSYDYWRSRFRGDSSAIGQTIRINGFPMTVVGVAEPGYHGLMLGYRPKLYIPVTMKRYATPSWDYLEDRRSRWLHVYGRLKKGVDIRQAEASIRTLHKQIVNQEVQDPYFNRVTPYNRQRFLASYAVLTPGGQGFSGLRRMMEMPLKVLMGLVGIVLLIACANVSNLLVARAAGRRKEIAVRLALGAGRWRVVRQLLVESALVALAGGALGLLVSYGSMRGILLLAPVEQAREAFPAAPDARALLFTLGISLAAALAFGLFPALQASSENLAAAMKDQAGSIAGGRGSRARKVLVAAQVTLSLILLVGSALFVQSLRNLRQVDPGFRVTNLIQFTVDPQLSGYENERTREFYRLLRRRLEALPGVESAALARVSIMGQSGWNNHIIVEGYQAGDGEEIRPSMNAVSPGYLKTLGIALKAGREFDEREHHAGAPAALVNESFAKRYFPGRSPLGRRIGIGRRAAAADITIIGVVADAHYQNLREEIPRQVFLPGDQQERQSSMAVYVRTSLPARQMFQTVRREVANIDARIPIYDMVTMEDQLDRSLALERMVAYLSSAYGLLAALLAVIGLYGVTAYGVTRRAREIGIRMALGAEAGAVLRMVLGEVLLLAGAGVAAALPVAWWLAEYARSQLYGIEPRDPATIALAAFSLLAVAAAAGALPAVKASRQNPLEVLRYE